MTKHALKWTSATSNSAPNYMNYKLRPLIKEDLQLVLSWRNHKKVRTFMLEQAIVSIDNHMRWFESAQSDSARKLLILENEGIPLGFMNLKKLCDGGVWEWGFYTAPDAPSGTGFVLTNAGLEYAFLVEKAHKVCGRVLAYNDRSLRVHHKVGFTQEGIMRRQHLIDGHWHDIYCFGCLETDWIDSKKNTQ